MGDAARELEALTLNVEQFHVGVTAALFRRGEAESEESEEVQALRRILELAKFANQASAEITQTITDLQDDNYNDLREVAQALQSLIEISDLVARTLRGRRAKSYLAVVERSPLTDMVRSSWSMLADAMDAVNRIALAKMQEFSAEGVSSIVLSAAGGARFRERLDNPPAPTDALRSLLED